MRWRVRLGGRAPLVSRGGVVMTGIVTLADDEGREGLRVRDGPAVSKLTHSMEALCDPTARQTGS